ncbi:hypothetical protein BMS3Abin05_02033 [bacterium BMS3Abin05]|nr:hypothetical protein BMS3Abin05_02033 [bacterium BMS3Abin05]
MKRLIEQFYANFFRFSSRNDFGERRFRHLEIGIGRPGKIMDIFRKKFVHSERIRHIAFHELPDCTHFEILWDKNRHIINTKIGKEFRCGVVLVAIPFAIFINADLGEPLSNHEEISIVARPGKNFWQFGFKFDKEFDLSARRDAFGKIQLRHRTVIRIAVVRGNKMK